jgi:hypothetical protein
VSISDRLRVLERRIGPTAQREREIEAAGRRLIDLVNRIDPDRDRETFEELRAQLQAAMRDAGRASP